MSDESHFTFFKTYNNVWNSIQVYVKKWMERLLAGCSDIDVINDNYDDSYTDFDDKLTTTSHLKALKESSEIILSNHDQDNI